MTDLKFAPEKAYKPYEVARSGIATISTLASLRSRGGGPVYVKMPGGIFYLGRDLNAWVKANTLRSAKEVAQ